MNTPAERARYYQRCVLAADAAGVPVSVVNGHLRQFAARLEPNRCAGGCGQVVTAAFGKEYCPDCLLQRKRERDRTYQHERRLHRGDREFLRISDVLARCADCGQVKLAAFFHIVALAPFCKTCGREIAVMRGEKGAQWDV